MFGVFPRKMLQLPEFSLRGSDGSRGSGEVGRGIGYKYKMHFPKSATNAGNPFYLLRGFFSLLHENLSHIIFMIKIERHSRFQLLNYLLKLRAKSEVKL